MAIVDGLITLADARASLGWADTDIKYNDDLERYIEAATPLIEYKTGPLIVRARTFTFDGGSTAVLLPVRFASVTTITESGSPVIDYVAQPTAGIIYAGTTQSPRSFLPGVQNVVVTVQVGSATVPPNVILATRELVRHLWQIGRQGNRPAYGQDAAETPPMGFAYPRRVLELLSPNADLAGFA